MKLILLILNLVLLNSCGASKQESLTNSNENAINREKVTLSGTYKIVAIDENDTLPDDLTISFDNKTNKVSGYSGCNQFMGDYTVENDSITFGPLMSTKRFCTDSINTIERKMLSALSKTQTLVFANEELSFMSGDTVVLKASKTETKSNKVAQESDYVIEYSAITRGFHNSLKLQNGIMTTLKGMDLKEAKKACSEEDLATLNKLLQELDLEKINTLEAPSKAHQYDGAPIGRLMIEYKGKTYQTPVFDAGNPNKYVAPLIEKLLAIAEMGK